MGIGVLGYSFAALMYFLLSVLLLTNWRGRIEGAYLVTAVLVTCSWAVASVFLQLEENRVTALVYQLFEAGKNVAWFVFLLRLLKDLRQAGGVERGFFRYLPSVVLGLTLLLPFLHILRGLPSFNPVWSEIANLHLLIGHLGFSIVGLALIEQLFRNTRQETRWAVKYLYLGIGSLFVYDFFLYADGLLYRQIDGSLWEARGFISILAVPLLVVAAVRNPNWSLSLFVSRRVVFHTTTLLGAGFYLLVTSGVGYYIRLYGGTWGKAVQAIFLFMAIVFLIMVLFSGQIRSRIKVFVNKHFFDYKYDYRDEWLRIIDTLSSGEPGAQIRERVIKAMADLVDSCGGALWMLDGSGKYSCVSSWRMPRFNTMIDANSSLINFFLDRDWVIDFQELSESPRVYDNLELPQGLTNFELIWLLLPIKHHANLIGFIVLKEPRAPRQINWEDRDLLKTAAQQAGSYLALMTASEALARANQFEAFNRLSAFVVHDLKNLLAQLELLVKNAERHRNNPAFMEDAINTVDNAAKKLGRLLAQLRKGRFEKSEGTMFLITDALRQAVEQHTHFEPRPVLFLETDGLQIAADRDRFTDVIGHIIKNAQEATSDTGYVKIRLSQQKGMAEIVIEDNGVGMDQEFIQERLFQPFETTKGNAGMGIGVYESREFIRSLGGNVEVLSEIERGTSFILRVPVMMSSGQHLHTNSIQEFEVQH
ncbi:MAG: XrtA/PEP-CTERM system histidine kinase PrsK [Pseudomonadota bacterium]